MARSIKVHPLSLAVGLVLGGICLLSMSQAVVAISPLRIEYAPHPRDMVQIRGGTPYTVPAGRVFVLTAIGGNNLGPYDPRLLINGLSEVIASSTPTDDTASMKAVPPGLTAAAGSVVELQDVQGGSSQNYRAWGYLAPQ
ncbi:MAG: hypothetical protein ACKVXR_15495 [Planctomycetota bacterium]